MGLKHMEIVVVVGNNVSSVHQIYVSIVSLSLKYMQLKHFLSKVKKESGECSCLNFHILFVICLFEDMWIYIFKKSFIIMSMFVCHFTSGYCRQIIRSCSSSKSSTAQYFGGCSVCGGHLKTPCWNVHFLV